MSWNDWKTKPFLVKTTPNIDEHHSAEHSYADKNVPEINVEVSVKHSVFPSYHGGVGIEKISPRILHHSDCQHDHHQNLHEDMLGPKIKLPLLNLISSTSTSTSSAPNSPVSSPLMQRARRLLVAQPQSSREPQKHQYDQDGHQIRTVNGDDGLRHHPANVYQVDGRKRSVSYSNFSNFYEM